MNEQIHIIAPGKLILCGEYAVLEGADALVMAVNKYLHLNISPSPGDESIFSGEGLKIPDTHFTLKNNKIFFDTDVKTQKKLELAANLMNYAIQHIAGAEERLRQIHIKIDSKDFYVQDHKLGFGSSAALAAALFYYFLARNENNFESPNKSQLIKLAWDSHRAFQSNKGSGIDIHSSVLGGMLQYRLHFGKEGTVSQYAQLDYRDLPLCVVYAGYSTSTSEMLHRVTDFKRQSPKEFSHLMVDMGNISSQAINAYLNHEVGTVIDNINEYRRLLDLLGRKSGCDIISGFHSNLAKIVESENGAYKPSGAGGGDIGIIVADSYERLEHIKKKLVKANILSIDISIDEIGVRDERKTY
ncbi:MAG: phosphomevalonate kinase [Calditrichia bacterium]